MRAAGVSLTAAALLAALSLSLPRLVPHDVEPGFLSPGDPRREGMVFVPGGFFRMGSTEEEIEELHRSYGGARALYESETPARKVYVEPFYIDRTEVTQRAYRRFLEAKGRAAPFVDREWARLYNWTGGAPPEGLVDHPVVLVSFEDARDYCRWAGKSLPTETEWEKAARGPDGRAYPWGDRWDASRLNSSTRWSDDELPAIDLWKKWWEGVYQKQIRGKRVTTMPVGSFPSGASPYGALDMAGNVFEWTDTWFEAYPGSRHENDEFGEKFRVVRGGDWYLDRIYTRAPARLRSPPEHEVPTIGFRCVCRAEDVR